MPIIIEGKLKNRKIEVICLNGQKGRSITIITPKGKREISYDDNLMWLPMFYAMPYELVEKRAAYLRVPRNIYQLMDSPEHMAMIESNVFLELVLIATHGLYGRISRCRKRTEHIKVSLAPGITTPDIFHYGRCHMESLEVSE